MQSSASAPVLSSSALDPLQAYLASLPEFQSVDRVEALYADFSSSRYSNPAGYSANVATWARIFYNILRLGLQPTPSEQTADRLVLHVGDLLLDGLRRPGVGRPYGLYSPIVSLSDTAANSPPVLFLRSEFMSAVRPISEGSSAYSLLSTVLRSVLQAVSGSYFDAEQRLEKLDLNQRWTAVKTDWVHLPLISEAAQGVIGRYTNSAATLSPLDRLFTLGQFRDELTTDLFSGSSPTPLSSSDTVVLLRHLQRDRRVLVFDGQIIKFVAPEQITANGQAAVGPPLLNETDRGIISVRETVNQLNQQIASIEKRIQQQTDQARVYLAKGRKELAASALRARKSLHELLARRLGTLDTLQTVYMKIEQSSSDVEIMAAYEKSASTLKSLLSNPSLNLERVERTVEDLQELVADEAEVENALKAGAVSMPIDEAELEAELAGLVAAETKAAAAEQPEEMGMLEERLRALTVPNNVAVQSEEERRAVAMAAS
ncbi:hypothetical protein CROQUDRAFT_35739 [Cronartium quercuum f. sp. fusiforme G11]|uniref:Uncharacterized protein n=1 Tax=Cronartium quercuum f. sp. fusiforme G11 TaxID=708437 RepID=A0A9P6NXE9_9BASI|nr:hypothetical protein CROQUDRAFT_35739 [Cronartium quercuum f. sp. fusiforme G11]